MSLGRILLIEDSDSICTVYAHVLREVGFALTYVTCGREALDILEKQLFEMVICDYCLPDTDGIQLVSTIKSKDENIYTIMLTSSSSKGIEEKGLASGIDDFILKPCKLDRLLLGVKRGMEIRRARVYRNVIEEKMTELSGLKNKYLQKER